MACVAVCPNGVNRVVQFEGRPHLRVDYERCKACGKCIDVCCYHARSIIGQEYTAEQLRDEILIDREYYNIGEKEGQGGGITLTGGEPMLQFDFIDHFLDYVKDINICMETCGYAPTWQYEKLLDRIDLFLFDYKVTNTHKHKELCGVDNQLILKNLDYLCQQKANIIVRIPLIPGINDDEEHLRAIAELINRHTNIRYGEIMAYHNLGVSKADNIGMYHKVLEQENATEKLKEEWLLRFREYGLEKIKIG
jgi:pyruvate formate lyase activating enzyme